MQVGFSFSLAKNILSKEDIVWEKPEPLRYFGTILTSTGVYFSLGLDCNFWCVILGDSVVSIAARGPRGLSSTLMTLHSIGNCP